jgi:hypothetical protein
MIGVGKVEYAQSLEIETMYKVPSTDPTPYQGGMALVVIAIGLVLSGVGDLLMFDEMSTICEGGCGFPWKLFSFVVGINSGTLGLTLHMQKRLAGWFQVLSIGMTILPLTLEAVLLLNLLERMFR